MRSGQPDPADDLLTIIETKRHTPSRTCEVVSEATRWLKAELDGCGMKYRYAACEDRDHYGHGVFTVIRSYAGKLVSLEIKVAEIKYLAYAYADVEHVGHNGGTLFPFYGEIASGTGRLLLLHYVSDFILSTEAAD